MFLYSCFCSLFIVLQYSEGHVKPELCDIYNLPHTKKIELEINNEYRTSEGTVPDCTDWRKYEIIKRVKNQGRCNACWAFSVIGNIESHRAIHLSISETLSEQFLIDCSSNSAGCNTTSLLKTLGNIVSEIGGVLPEKDYFQYADKKDLCRWKRPENNDKFNEENKLKVFKRNAQNLTARYIFIFPYDGIVEEHEKAINVPEEARAMPVPVVGLRRVQSDEEVMKEFVYRHGPLSAAINSAAMAKYGNGKNYIDEPTDEQCNPKELDHSILIVGYNSYVDQKSGRVIPYWIIKNSWGNVWGDEGFYYLVRGRNACGIASDASFVYVN